MADLRTGWSTHDVCVSEKSKYFTEAAFEECTIGDMNCVAFRHKAEGNSNFAFRDLRTEPGYTDTYDCLCLPLVIPKGLKFVRIRRENDRWIYELNASYLPVFAVDIDLAKVTLLHTPKLRSSERADQGHDNEKSTSTTCVCNIYDNPPMAGSDRYGLKGTICSVPATTNEDGDGLRNGGQIIDEDRPLVFYLKMKLNGDYTTFRRSEIDHYLVPTIVSNAFVVWIAVPRKERVGWGPFGCWRNRTTSAVTKDLKKLAPGQTQSNILSLPGTLFTTDDLGMLVVQFKDLKWPEM